MKFKTTALYIITTLFFFACKKKEEQQLDTGDLIAKGSIQDSIYQGLIKFYDKKTGKLVKEATYTNGLANGSFKEYYNNGAIKIEANFDNGKQNGYTSFFDSAGALKLKNYIYYDLRVGPFIEYNNSKPGTYSFYSLENELLFHIAYDSIFNKGMLEIARDFFFVTSYPVYDTATEYRVYNINPPGYKFNYSLVTVDKSKNIISTIRDVNNGSIWHVFLVPKGSLPKDRRYALKIVVQDSINNLDCQMQKMLPDQEPWN